MVWLVIGLIIFVVLIVNKQIDTKEFVQETEPYFRFLMEKDYEFYLTVKYNEEASPEMVRKLFGQRVRNGLVTIIAVIIFNFSNLNFINILVSFIAGYIVFKLQYINLKNYYKANLHKIDLMLPYYLKGLEILIQHYTVPVALARSIQTAPEIFRPGLQKMIARIESGDQSVDPYMEFAKDYPVRDSMRMMRLLYRLGLGSQENKQEQLMMFSRTVSNLQNKSREQKYKNRLEKMERKTMTMLAATGGGIIFLLLMSMLMISNI